MMVGSRLQRDFNAVRSPGVLMLETIVLFSTLLAS